MKNDISESVRKVVEDKIKYLQGVATDYALRYANTDAQEDKVAYLKYKFASEQLGSVRMPISLGLNDLEKLIKE
jgi:hypothetical protein